MSSLYYISGYRNDTSQYRKTDFVNCFGILAYFLFLTVSVQFAISRYLQYLLR
uniref:Uncharacterized protein n=1 Tax=Picea sitchensis TaxID=3332 RepID=A0A6B9XXM4_PICSI|nr:hypothetical protein Q903MT_gene6847 [Picea sitchensis]